MRLKPSGVRRSPDLLAGIVLTATLCFLVAMTWEKWGSVTVDSGREMYLPAAINKGKRLYLDLWYPYGPVVPYWNALLFKIFGTNLSILYGSGIAIVGLVTLIVYRLSRLFLPVWLSYTAAFSFVVESLQAGIFNYILPYSYAAAYGSLLALTVAFVLVSNCLQPRPWRMAAAGLLSGLSLLTKLEFGLAACGVLASAIAIRATTERSLDRLGRDVALAAPCLLIAVGVYSWLVAQTSIAFMFEQNIPILPGSYFARQFGQTWARSAGIPDSLGSVLAGAAWCIAGGVLLVAILGVTARSRVLAWVTVVLTAIGCVSALSGEGSELTWIALLLFNPGLIWASVLLLVVVSVRWWRDSLEPKHAATMILCLSSMGIGLRMSGLMGPTGYSIFYDFPAYIGWLVLIYTALQQLRIPHVDRMVSTAGALLALGVVALSLAVYARIVLQSYPVRTEWGTIYTLPSTGEAYARILTRIAQANARSERWVTWPEDVSLYYLSDSLAPSRWYLLLPGVLPSGDLTRDYIADLDRVGVKYVFLSNRATPEYGAPLFGADYNRELYEWLTHNFHVVETIGRYERVPHPSAWGALVYERVVPPPGSDR